MELNVFKMTLCITEVKLCTKKVVSNYPEGETKCPLIKLSILKMTLFILELKLSNLSFLR